MAAAWKVISEKQQKQAVETEDAVCHALFTRIPLRPIVNIVFLYWLDESLDMCRWGLLCAISAGEVRHAVCVHQMRDSFWAFVITGASDRLRVEMVTGEGRSETPSNALSAGAKCEKEDAYFRMEDVLLSIVSSRDAPVHKLHVIFLQYIQHCVFFREVLPVALVSRKIE